MFLVSIYCDQALLMRNLITEWQYLSFSPDAQRFSASVTPSPNGSSEMPTR